MTKGFSRKPFFQNLSKLLYHQLSSSMHTRGIEFCAKCNCGHEKQNSTCPSDRDRRWNMRGCWWLRDGERTVVNIRNCVYRGFSQLLSTSAQTSLFLLKFPEQWTSVERNFTKKCLNFNYKTRVQRHSEQNASKYLFICLEQTFGPEFDDLFAMSATQNCKDKISQYNVQSCVRARLPSRWRGKKIERGN